MTLSCPKIEVGHTDDWYFVSVNNAIGYGATYDEALRHLETASFEDKQLSLDLGK